MTYYENPNNWLFPETSGLSHSETEIDEARENLQQLYTTDERPWFIGYSGGKDSTLLLQLCLEVAKSNGYTKRIIVGYNDTGVELPNKLDLVKIQGDAINKITNCQFVFLHPKPEERYLAMVIGRGFAAPCFRFHWCTERLKLRPTNELLKRNAPIITFTGSRSDESSKRKKRLSSEKYKGFINPYNKRLCISICEPIKKVRTKDVWEYLRNTTTEWGESFEDLTKFYPYGIEASSRDGCCLCTVCSERKFDDCGTWQNELRNKLRKYSNSYDKRGIIMTPRGRYYQDKGIPSGYFKPEVRFELLNFVKELERRYQCVIIPSEEEEAILEMWKNEVAFYSKC